MYQWSDEQEMMRDAVRQFVEAEIAPNVDELEHGDTPPYDTLRKLWSTFGLDAAARDRFERQMARERAAEAGERPMTGPASAPAGAGTGA